MTGGLSAAIQETFGEPDIYVFDQLLKGRFDRVNAVLDAGCGEGRNLHYLLSRGVPCFGIDRQPGAIEGVRGLAAALAPSLPPGNFVTGEVDALPWDDDAFDAVICSAVLHFARDEAHFDRMVRELWRVLAPGGMLFARLAGVYGPDAVPGARAAAPDGGFRFLVDEAMLLERTAALGGALLDPIKTTVVYGQRAMTTWVVRKGSQT